jgi:hypothetical protein
MQRTQHHRILEGQRFRALEGMEWEFSEFILTHRGEHPHVALVKPLDRLTRKVISVDALLDKRLFSLIESPGRRRR